MTVLDRMAPEAAAVASPSGLRVAVASSGLGHIRRGIETWAADLAAALRRAGQDVTLFAGAGEPEAEWQRVLHCRKRFDADVERWVRLLGPRGGWRFGFGSGYDVEQTSFTLRLWREARRDFDLVHVQDPRVAQLMDQLHRLGLSRPRVILAHGTEEPAERLRAFAHLQHLAPCYLEEGAAAPGQKVFAVPNFVDTRTFHPGDRAQARVEWKLPEEDLIVLCVAAIKKGHKRVDYLVREFARFREWYGKPATLVVAGARELETDEVKALGAKLLGSGVRFLESVNRQRIPSLYRAADVFALASLHEMMPIAVLEALASGLPIACNATPTLRWMVGPAGRLNDLSREGALADQLKACTNPAARAAYARAAREHAVASFSEEVVVQQVLEMYRSVTGRA